MGGGGQNKFSFISNAHKLNELLITNANSEKAGSYQK